MQKSIIWETWTRHDNYQIEKVNGRDYIRAVPESGWFKLDFNDIGREKGTRKPKDNYLVEALLNLDLADNQAIITFVKTFGLLGLLQTKYLDPRKVTIDGKELHFIPERHGDGLIPVEEVALNFLLDPKELISEGLYITKPKASEPLSEFKEAVADFQRLGKLITRIKLARNNRSGPLRAFMMQEKEYKEAANTEDTGTLIKIATLDAFFILFERNSNFNRSFNLDAKGDWKSRWRFDSLLSAAYFFFTQDLAGNYWLGECERCKKIYLSSVGTQKFCSRKCEDATRKANARQKEKEVH